MAFATFLNLIRPEFGAKIGTPMKVYNFHGQVRTFSGGGNKVDVMLLQALFRIFYYEFVGRGSARIPRGSTGVIEVDGIVGKQTRIHIDDFQKQAVFFKVTLTADGVIDPFKKPGILTPHTGVPFQLLQLNFTCQSIAFRNGDIDVHQRMIDQDKHPDPIYPPALRSALRVPVVMR